MQRKKKHLGLHYNGIFFQQFGDILIFLSRLQPPLPPGKRAKNNMKKKKLRRKHFNTEWALDLLTF